MAGRSTAPVSLDQDRGSVNFTTRTVTSLRRWSCEDKSLPDVSQIKAIHVYDFDNTLFCSPLPNKDLWDGPTVGQLGGLELLVTGGWWHDPSLLAATGEGADKEEARAWEGWWNEDIVKLVRLSMEQEDALNILLTGRAEDKFSGLIRRMVNSKKLAFDMICLKPSVGPNSQKFRSTMAYKQELLNEVIFTYKDAEEFRIYEDRPPHVKGFQVYLAKLNSSFLNAQAPVKRGQLKAEVVQVCDKATTLDPVIEVATIQGMINSHNLAVRNISAHSDSFPLTIKRTVFYTGYLISPPVTESLRALVKSTMNVTDRDVRFLSNNILITPKPATPEILKKVGGLGHKFTWRVSGVGSYDHSIWAARVEPVTTGDYHVENPVPVIILARRRSARAADVNLIQNWQPVSPDQRLEFETVVGEKMLLRIDREQESESEQRSPAPNYKPRRSYREEAESRYSTRRSASPYSGSSRRYSHGDDRRRYQPGDDQRSGAHYSPRPRGSSRGRGGRGASVRAGRGRGRGGGPSHYRSLDDMERAGGPGYNNHQSSNDDRQRNNSRQRDNGLPYHAY